MEQAEAIRLNDKDIVRRILNWANLEADADDLARATGEIFGGECHFIGDKYRFRPGQNYIGAFGDLEGDEPFLAISEGKLLDRILRWTNDADADEIARICGEIFGGECYFVEGEYRFYPTGNYMGAFAPKTA